MNAVSITMIGCSLSIAIIKSGLLEALQHKSVTSGSHKHQSDALTTQNGWNAELHEVQGKREYLINTSAK
jgi:hypothetical protein